MSDANTIVMLEAKVEELQTINNKLTKEIEKLKEKIGFLVSLIEEDSKH